MATVGTTNLDVFPLCFGANVFGWTVDEQDAFHVLDAYAAAGGNFIDTADVYPAWAEGRSGGESETIIGNWQHARGNRDRLIIATKVGRKADREGLSAANVRVATEESLARLRTDRIDLLYSHTDDETVPLEETLGAFDALVREGLVRHVAASNYTAPRLTEALAVSDREGLQRYVALQPKYNLMDRAEYEGDLANLCQAEHLSCFPYQGLASGFLTGKYRPGRTDDISPRAETARGYLDARGTSVLDALDEIAAEHRSSVAAVSLAWLLSRPAVISPIASARTPDQLADLLPALELSLTTEELDRLDTASNG